MGAQQREYKKRIGSAKGMKKIFQAQEMIAAARISKAHARVQATTPYAKAITDAIASVVQHAEETNHPFLEADRTFSNRVGVLLITSDRGMAGSYSPSAIREAEHLTNKLREEGKQPVLYVVGRKGDSYYRFRNRPAEKSWIGVKEEDLPKLGREISAPLQLSADGAESRLTRQYPLYEYTPSADEVFEQLVPRYVESRIINILLQSIASEHASRQKAMKTATDNAETQIQKFTRLANSARQAEITQEITEIVGGADALNASGRKER